MSKGILISGVDSNFSSVSGVFYSEEEYDQLFQQLSDVSNERDSAQNGCMELSSRVRELEHKMDYWSGNNEALKARLNASEARNTELCDLLQMFIENSDDGDVVDLSRHALAQSEPATGEQCDHEFVDGHCKDCGEEL